MSNNKREYRSSETVRRKNTSGSFSSNSDECAMSLFDKENQPTSEMQKPRPRMYDNRVPRPRRVTEGDLGINDYSNECVEYNTHAYNRADVMYNDRNFGPHRSHTTTCMQHIPLICPQQQMQAREQDCFISDNQYSGNRITTRKPFSNVCSMSEHCFYDNKDMRTVELPSSTVKSYHETDVKTTDRRGSMPNLQLHNRISLQNETPVRTTNPVIPSSTSKERLNQVHEKSSTRCQRDGESNSGYGRIGGRQQNDDTQTSPKFYRRGFYIILTMNTIIMILNVVGLPFVYSNTSMSTEVSSRAVDTPKSMCVECSILENNFKVDPVLKFGFSRNVNSCCLMENEMLVFLHELMNKIKTDIKKDTEIKSGQYNRTAFIQVTASQIVKIEGKSVLGWTLSKPNESLTLTDNDTAIAVAVPGYYFVYSRVHYKKEIDKGEMSKVGHKLINMATDTILDSIEQNCYYANLRSDHAEHTTILESVLQLGKGDKIILTVDNYAFLQFKDSKLGMFLFSRR